MNKWECWTLTTQSLIYQETHCLVLAFLYMYVFWSCALTRLEVHCELELGSNCLFYVFPHSSLNHGGQQVFPKDMIELNEKWSILFNNQDTAKNAVLKNLGESQESQCVLVCQLEGLYEISYFCGIKSEGSEKALFLALYQSVCFIFGLLICHTGVSQ